MVQEIQRQFEDGDSEDLEGTRNLDETKSNVLIGAPLNPEQLNS